MPVHRSMSFWLAIVVIVVTASISVVWSLTHILVLLVDIALIAGLRQLAWWEGQRS